MYVIIFAILLGLIFLFYSTITSLTDQAKSSKIGQTKLMIWFYGLLILNIMIILTIHIHKFYIENYQLEGNTGPRGYDGRRGINGVSVCTSKY
jgi:hypothetical protein